MTKQDFLSGKPFRVASNSGYVNYKGASTFFYDGSCMMKQTRSSIDENILYSDYHMNIKTIGDKWFSGFTYVMNKKVQIRLKFEQLVEFRQEA